MDRSCISLAVKVLPCVLRCECRCEAEAALSKAEHSEILMKRDSEVCWSRMSLSCEQRGREPAIEYCCWPIVKSQLNSSSIIITICFPYRGMRSGAAAEAESRRTLCFALTLVFSAGSVLVAIASWLHLSADSCHWSYLTPRLHRAEAAAPRNHFFLPGKLLNLCLPFTSMLTWFL